MIEKCAACRKYLDVVARRLWGDYCSADCARFGAIERERLDRRIDEMREQMKGIGSRQSGFINGGD